jgi:plasmid maintenance system antidote protein VapI
MRDVFPNTEAFFRGFEAGNAIDVEIVNGQRAIIADTAVRLAAYFGTDAQSWMNLQTLYDTEMAREKIGEDRLSAIKHARAA